MLRKFVLVSFAVLFLGSVSACGKSLDQLKKTAKDLVDVAGSVYEDVKDNVETVKEVLKEHEEHEHSDSK